MAKVVVKPHPLISAGSTYHFFNEDEITAGEVLDRLDCKKYNLHCKVNGIAPDEMGLDYIFKKDDVVEISTIVQGGGGGGNKLVRTLATVAIIAATVATGGAAGVALLGTTGAAIAAAAVAIGGNLLVNSLFPAEPPGSSIPEASGIGNSIQSVSVSAARNPNLINQPHCLNFGCTRSAPPHGMQPYSTLVDVSVNNEVYTDKFITNDVNDPSSIVCFQYTKDGANEVRNIANGVYNNSLATLPNKVSYFDICQPYTGYPHQVSVMRHYNGPQSPFSGPIPLSGFFNTRAESATQLYSKGIPSFNGTNRTNATNDAAQQLDNIGQEGRWDYHTYQPQLGTNGPTFLSNYPFDKGYALQSGLGGFEGFCVDSWVFICTGPDAGWYVRQSAFDLAGGNLALIASGDDKIFGNPTFEPDGITIDTADEFCDPRVEFCITEQNSSTVKNQRIHQIFNYGYGDLKISDSFFGTTPVEKLIAFESTTNDKGTTDWPMAADSCAEERVDTTAGGQLFFNDIVSGPTTPVAFTDQNQYNWIERCGVEKTNRIDVNINGNLYFANPQIGIQSHSEDIQIQYRPYNSTGAWQGLDGGAGEYTLTGYTTSPVNETFTSGIIPPDKYCVRVRRLSEEDTDVDLTSKLALADIKWFQEDTKPDGTPVNYLGQNREATCLVATGQINGALGNYTSIIKTNKWIFDIDEFKATGECNWVWDCEAGTSTSSNPAFAFLYFLRGGFANPTADGSLAYPYSPTQGWVNNADHPDNEERLFGGGIREKLIDLDCIKDWACYCHENEFCFDYYSCGEDKSIKDMLSLITRAGRATWTLQNGKYCPLFEEANQPAVTVFSEENILKDTFQVCYDSGSDISKIELTFSSPNEELGDTESDDNFDAKPIQLVSDVPFAKRRGSTQKINLAGVQKKKQAQREANLIAAKQFYNKRTYTWDTNIQHLCVNRGDIVILSSDLTQASFSARFVEFKVVAGAVTEVTLTRKIEKNVDNFKVKYVTGELVDVTATKIDDNTFAITSYLDASRMPCTIDQVGTPNPNNLSDLYGHVPEDIMVIGAALQTPGKRVRITDIEIRDICKASITAIDDDPAVYAYEYHNCPDPVVLEENEIDPFVCAKVFNVLIEDCGDGLARVHFETEGAIGVQAQYSIDGSTPVNVIINSMFTITGNSFEIQAASGTHLEVFIQPIVVNEPYNSTDGCAEVNLT